jgi:NAD(P)-dependent dehydrogenase (short-subunit alcohol dehydrogenase family)
MAINVQDRTVALVTGATTGVGLATARRLAAMGGTVIIHGPDATSATGAQGALRTALPDASVYGRVADFASLDEVMDLATQIEEFGRLDILVNNAAAVFDDWSTNGLGVERTFVVNHLASYLLTRSLLPLLERTGGRVVMVASEAHRAARWHSDHIEHPAHYERFDAYSRSKQANLLFNAELARRLNGRSVTTNAVHPGTVRTRLFQPRNLAERIAMPVINLKAVSPEQASDGVAWLATAAELSSVSGGYYHDRKRLEPSPAATDEQNAFELWKLSAELTDLPLELASEQP